MQCESGSRLCLHLRYWEMMPCTSRPLSIVSRCIRRASIRSESHCTGEGTSDLQWSCHNYRCGGPTKDLHVHEVAKLWIRQDKQTFHDDHIGAVKILSLFGTLMFNEGVDRYLYALAVAQLAYTVPKRFPVKGSRAVEVISIAEGLQECQQGTWRLSTRLTALLCSGVRDL